MRIKVVIPDDIVAKFKPPKWAAQIPPVGPINLWRWYQTVGGEHHLYNGREGKVLFTPKGGAAVEFDGPDVSYIYIPKEFCVFLED